MIRVGRCTYDKSGKRTDPTYPGFTPILVMMKSHSDWWQLSPYYVKDEKGRYLENIWQFSKVYEKVPKSTQKYSRYNSTVIWDYPEEVHYKDNKLTKGYLKWRKKGMSNKYPVRYPVGFHHRHKCLFAIKDVANPISLNYVDSRKEIYVKEYCKLVKTLDKFKELQARLQAGENLLIIEVDGPHQESASYYQKKYNADKKFIDKSTILINENNIQIMLNDDKHAFGHGYCLGMTLLNKEDEWNY